MSNRSPVHDPAFIEGQRQTLIAHRVAISSAIDLRDSEVRELDEAARGQALEAEDKAQELMITENDRTLIDSLAEQLQAIDRALAKIDAGTYGFSEISGVPMPRARLLAQPEATRIMSEETTTP